MAITKKNMAIAAAKKKAAEEKVIAQEAPKKPKMMPMRYAVMKDGSRYKILRSDGKYLYCDGTTIRQLDSRLDRIETVREPIE